MTNKTPTTAGPTVYAFGAAALDFRIRTADFGSEYRDKLLSRGTEILGGGAAANALVQVSRLGGQAGWLGVLGNDWIGDRIIEQLESEGVGCGNVIRRSGVCSPFNLAVYAGESRRRIGGFLLPNSLGETTDEEAARLAAVPRTGDVALIELGEIPMGRCRRFAAACREKGVLVVLDVDLDPVLQCGATQTEFDDMTRDVDLLMPNHRAMGTLYPDLSPEELTIRMSREFSTPTVVTAGGEGAYTSIPEDTAEPFGGSKATMHHPALPVGVLDTVGAGDAFHGGVVFGLSRDMPLAKAVELGTYCGAMNCTSTGARGGMPTAEDLIGASISPEISDKIRKGSGL